MNYYKLINGQNIVGIATNDNYRRYQEKRGLSLATDISKAQYFEVGGIFYRDNWLKNLGDAPILCIDVQIIAIDENEYIALEEAFKTNEVIQNDMQEEPEVIIDEDVVSDPDITVEYIREMKIQQMRKICHDTIVAGFDIVLSDEKVHHFSLEIEDQLKIQALAIKAEKGDTILPWHSDGELCKFYSALDIMAIYSELERLQTVQTTYFNSLRQYINSLETIPEIIEVEYGMGIPEEYQSEVLKYLLNN